MHKRKLNCSTFRRLNSDTTFGIFFSPIQTINRESESKLIVLLIFFLRSLNSLPCFLVWFRQTKRQQHFQFMEHLLCALTKTGRKTRRNEIVPLAFVTCNWQTTAFKWFYDNSECMWVCVWVFFHFYNWIFEQHLTHKTVCISNSF